MHRSHFLQVVASVLFSLLFSLVGVLVFAFLIKVAELGGGVVSPVVRVLQGASVVLGAGLYIRGEGGLVKGALSGLFSAVFAFFLFSLIAERWQIGVGDLMTVLYLTVVGAIAGVVAVNVKK